ncbi:MAG: cytochrome c biogenesis protein CcsA, partial [Thermodesulfobacteriota bacterium]
WAVAGVYLLLLWKFRLPVLGAFASPLALLLVVLGYFLAPGGGEVGPVYDSPGLNLLLTAHLGSVFAGYGFFGLAFVAGIMYLLQERQIKSKRPGAIFHRLPSLHVLDHMNHYCLTLGFPLMTLGLITGSALAQLTLGTYWRWDPKEVWSLVLWLVYAALLHQRLTVGWRGRRAALMALAGFAVLCFTFLGVSLLLPGYHSFESLRLLRMP